MFNIQIWIWGGERGVDLTWTGAPALFPNNSAYKTPSQTRTNTPRGMHKCQKKKNLDSFVKFLLISLEVSLIGQVLKVQGTKCRKGANGRYYMYVFFVLSFYQNCWEEKNWSLNRPKCY